MNKKTMALILAVLIIVVAAGAFLILNNSKDNSAKTNNQQNTNADMNNNSKIAVIYFSATGTTESVAKKIQSVTKGDIIEIVPKSEYTSADLNYNSDCRANREQNDSSARPEIKNEINIDDYDTIYLGYPIWWGDVPKIILTFLDSYNLDGKKVMPFCTSGGSGIETSVNTLKKYNDKIKWSDGRRFNSSVSENELRNWINS